MGEARIRRRAKLGSLLVLAALTVGCNRRDAEAMSRIGKKLAVIAGDLKENLDSGWQGVYKGARLEARVSARLRWEKSLADTAIQVKAAGNDIELTGTVQTQEQKRRALDLALSTAGVDKVNETLDIRGP